MKAKRNDIAKENVFLIDYANYVCPKIITESMVNFELIFMILVGSFKI